MLFTELMLCDQIEVQWRRQRGGWDDAGWRKCRRRRGSRPERSRTRCTRALQDQGDGRTRWHEGSRTRHQCAQPFQVSLFKTVLKRRMEWMNMQLTYQKEIVTSPKQDSKYGHVITSTNQSQNRLSSFLSRSTRRSHNHAIGAWKVTAGTKQREGSIGRKGAHGDDRWTTREHRTLIKRKEKNIQQNSYTIYTISCNKICTNIWSLYKIRQTKHFTNTVGTRN